MLCVARLRLPAGRCSLSSVVRTCHCASGQTHVMALTRCLRRGFLRSSCSLAVAHRAASRLPESSRRKTLCWQPCMPSRVCVRVRRCAGVPVRSPHRRLAISLSFDLRWRHALLSPRSKRRGPLSQPLSFRFVPAAPPSFAHAPPFGPRRRPAPRASLPVTCAVRSRCCVTHGSFACRRRRCVPGRRRRASLTASFAACACASPPFRCGERCAERGDRVEMAVAAALTTQLLGARGGLRRAMGCVDWVVGASGDAGWGQRAGRGRQREGRGRGGGGRTGQGAGSVGEVTRRCSGQGTWQAAGGASALKTSGHSEEGGRCVAFSSLFLESAHKMQAMFFLAVALAAAGRLVRDGDAAAGDTVMEFRALCRLATALDAFRHLNASALWQQRDPETQIKETLNRLAGEKGGERPCGRRARAFIGGRAQHKEKNGRGHKGTTCEERTKEGDRQGKELREPLLCRAKEAKTQAEEKIKKAKRLAHEALWGKEEGQVNGTTLQTKTWADNPSASTLAGVGQADEHCVASNVLWLCMDSAATHTANPCFKNAAVTALSKLTSHTHSNCHTDPKKAFAVWEALEPLCINETAEEARPADELATTALAAAENVIAKIHDISDDGQKFILGKKETTAGTCTKGGDEICIKFGSATTAQRNLLVPARQRSPPPSNTQTLSPTKHAPSQRTPASPPHSAYQRRKSIARVTATKHTKTVSRKRTENMTAQTTRHTEETEHAAQKATRTKPGQVRKQRHSQQPASTAQPPRTDNSTQRQHWPSWPQGSHVQQGTNKNNTHSLEKTRKGEEAKTEKSAHQPTQHARTHNENKRLAHDKNNQTDTHIHIKGRKHRAHHAPEPQNSSDKDTKTRTVKKAQRTEAGGRETHEGRGGKQNKAPSHRGDTRTPQVFKGTTRASCKQLRTR
ncbi:hypothetical protein, conserved in T. vivax [Trypanosoma vivax Y486]|uniref:Uncharacterized protein n=1 Tax=Trypanosoma vivax (strain Y486) TaxID=1055687 RepID=F9WRE1_TRYVY|nr:hypothetical protein, conserved in T. vivax [Trypanosoma vivax Y486]|eukprot:CCD20125.1 hypothetical protein, conserved in T. vivax [Trypanosoma vivax Y486]